MSPQADDLVPKMDPEFKAKWIAALRNGSYEQGLRKLRSGDNRFCCLGVAIDLCGTEWKHIGNRYEDGDGMWAYLGIHGRARIGITDAQETRLATMNDQGKTFAEIADYIEAHL